MKRDDDGTVTTIELARLLGVTSKTVAELAKAGIIERASRGRWLLEAFVSSYCRHLREQAAGPGGEAGADVRARPGAAQAKFTEAKAKQLAGELVEASEVNANPVWRMEDEVPRP